MASSPLPVLLPPEVIRVPQPASFSEWTPKSYLNAPQAPPMDDAKSHDLEMAAARQMMDGKALKKTRPRRTVDYAGGMGRWNLVSTEFMCLYFSMALITSISRPVAQDPTEPEICPIFEAESTLYSRCTVYSSNAIRQLETSTEWAVLQLLPPKAYPDTASTSLCTKFVHTSTNKIRCPVNVVVVRRSSRETSIEAWIDGLHSFDSGRQKGGGF